MQTLDTLIAPYKSLSVDELRVAAEKLGIPYGTLYRVVKGYTPNPRYSTVAKLQQAYDAQ